MYDQLGLTMSENTTTSMVKMLKVKDETYAELIDIGKYSETMDDIVRKCLEAYKEKKGLKSKK
jgi:hypothetical protein